MSTLLSAAAGGTDKLHLESWSNIPAELRERPQWCLAGDDKRPRMVDGRPASPTDPTTWTDFVTVCRAAEQRSCDIGYVQTADDPLSCVDMDVKDTTSAETLDHYHSIINSLDSYTERSRSGRGFHTWVKGKIGRGKRERDGVEVYSQGRFMICTGDVFRDRPVAERQEMLTNMIAQMNGGTALAEPLADGPEMEGDEDILARARSAANAAKFNAHYNGDFAAIGHEDESVADLALIQMLSHYTRHNEQLKRLFVASALGQRDKARKRKDYVDRTIKTARSFQATGPNAEHGREMALAIITSALMKQLRPQPSARAPEGFRLISEAEMAARPHVRWRVREVVPEEGVVAVYGPPGSGKSFLVLDMLGAISTGREWFGHRVRAAPVVYAALEGKAGVSQRVRAYRARRGPMTGVKFIDAPIDMRRKEDRTAVISAIREAGWENGVLCIDTLAASAPGIDENTSKDMGELIAALQEVQEALGGVVLVVHHTGKDQSRGLRGWSGLTGALDGAIEVSRDEDRREWRVAKAKDGSDGERVPFDLDVIVLDLDEDGLPISSCVVVGGNPSATQEAITAHVLAIMKEFQDRGEYMATAPNSPNSAYRILKDEPQFPRAISSKALTALLRQAERDGLITREKYKDQHRNERERWQVL